MRHFIEICFFLYMFCSLPIHYQVSASYFFHFCVPGMEPYVSIARALAIDHFCSFSPSAFGFHNL